MTSTSLAATLILSVATVAADSFLKRAGQETQMLNVWFAFGTAIYTASAFGWVYVFRHLTFAEAGTIYTLSVMLMPVLAGIVFFSETLKISEGIGIAFAVVSILLLRRFA